MSESRNDNKGNSLVSIRDLYRKFNISGGLLDQLSFKKGRISREIEYVRAVNGVSLEIKKGEALCLVGESGCGKTTVGRLVMGLLSPTGGTISYQGERIDTLGPRRITALSKENADDLQNPYASLNPRKTVANTLLEPARFHFPKLTESEHRDKVNQVMQSVGVDVNWGARFPHEFSGGQRQRISIARALMVDPEFIVADEPISALDVSIQAQVFEPADASSGRTRPDLFIYHP